MKKSLFIISLFVYVSNTFAQYARLVVFTENGDRFFLYVNGKLQNASLQSNVTTKKITEQGVTMRVVFDKEGRGEKLYKIPVKPGYELTCALKVNSKGEYVIRYAGEALLEDEPVNEPEPEAQQQSRKVPASQANENTDGENVDININMGIGGLGGNTNIKYTQKVASTSSSSANYSQPQSAESAAVVKPTSCLSMDIITFQEAKKSVASKGFDETRITESKQILDENCMSAKQVKDLLSVFVFEESRLEVAKYAYKKCSDRNNYFMVNAAFQFETSVEELNIYIKSVR